MVGGPFFIVNSDVIKRVGYFDKQFKVVGDYDWFIKAGRSGLKFVRVFSIVGIYLKQEKLEWWTQ